MSMRAVSYLSLFLGLILTAILPPAALAQTARAIETTADSDYFGFDLRAEKDVSLDQCKSACLSDQSCRAFTYNTRARWCFLKSDYNALNPFAGAIAGKVVALTGEPDIGAPADLDFFPARMVDEARQFRARVTASTAPEGYGLAFLIEDADAALAAANPRRAIQSYTSALVISPDDWSIWTRLARADLAAAAAGGEDVATLRRNASSAVWNGYILSRTASARAEVLATMAEALEARAMYRPALQAYEASLLLVDDAAVRAAYLDLRARKGFRVVDHSVDTDTASPRICVQFSEDLVKTGVDYATFVTLDNAAPPALEARERELCVEGLQHGRHYRVALRSGLPAAIGETLQSPVTLSVYVQDRPASVRFTGDDFVLPGKARRGIPLVSVNTTGAKLSLHRVGERSLSRLVTGYQFLRQLNGYDVSQIADDLGQPVWEGEIDIQNALNEEVVTSFPVDEALPERDPGIYVLTAQPKDVDSEYWENRATQWFVVSDIGLSTYTGEDGLNVFARSLDTADALAGVELTLLARNNEVLGTAVTDAAGRATFTPGLARGDGGMAPATVTAKNGADDFVFLDMTQGGFDLSDRGVTGRPAPGAIDAFAWTERGIYRAGETVHAAVLLRSDTSEAIENLPVTFVFSRPDGVEDRRIVSARDSAGGHAVDLALQANAMRGTWTMRVYTDPKAATVAEKQFLVEDFVPDRIEFDLATADDSIALGETAEVEVDGRFLYGAPAAGLAVEGEVAISPVRTWSAFPGYLFGLADEEESDASSRFDLTDLPVLDDDGKATIDVAIEDVPSTTRLLEARVVVRVREAGGRAVERDVKLSIAPETEMIGIRPDFSGNEVPEGSIAKFKVIAADENGQRISLAGLNWSVVKIVRNYQWYRQNGSWNYEPVTFTQAVSDGHIAATVGEEATISVPVDWGRYRLEIETADPTGPATSVEFTAGWYVESASTETPDALEMALDRENYAVGEVAKLQVSPRFAGKLLVAVGADRLLDTFTADIPEGGGTVDIPVSAEWGAGAYVTATLFRPGGSVETRMPNRAIGVKWLAVDPGDRKLEMALGAPAQAMPRGPLTIPVTLAGLDAGEAAYVTVAAVDVGILNLTRYTPPDPEGWYFGQRRLGLELRDIYGRLIDGSAGAAGRIRSGGDGGMASEGSPPTEELVAYFEGPVRVGPDGTAMVTFDLPQFNGTARIMAVGWTKKAVGHVSEDVVIRDPVVVTAGLPRFLAPGDESRIRLDIANTDGPAGVWQVNVATIGGVELSADAPQTIDLAAGARTAVVLPVTATETGDAGITVTLVHESGTQVVHEMALPVRPGALPVTTRRTLQLAANGGSITIDRELLADSILDGAFVSLGVSSVSAFDIPSLLMSLDRYPYGCAEQTTSRALPLLYVSELSSAAGMEEDPALHDRVQKAILRVLSYQSSSGSFGLWGPGYGDLWLDAYVSDFLTRSRELDYDVPAEAMQHALENLQNQLSYNNDVKANGTEIAYALYVLARNRKASVGDLRYYADTRIDEFASPMARAQIAAALALYGDSQRAERAFGSALRLAESGNGHDIYRGDYGSALRDGAAMLALAAETRPAPALIPQMISYVSATREKARYLSTQDEAWMLLAARAIKAGSEAIRLEVDGAPHTGSYARRMTGAELVASPVTVRNLGANPVDAVVTTVAAPAEPLPAGGDGFTITRAYYNLDGTEANISEAPQNERFVVVLKATELNAWPSRVLVTDLLPAGFEIDNPRLVGSAELANFDWLGQTDAAHTEFRNDRFVAAFDRTQGSSRDMVMAYVVRAVTPGVYVHPAASVEDMYRPQFSARTASGLMEVVTPQ